MNRERFFGYFTNRPSSEVRRIQMAYWLAKEVHRTTACRDNGERYFEHPRRVAVQLAEIGYPEAEAIVLALLHDAIEDAMAPISVYENLFGADTTSRILVLSKKIPVFETFSGLVVTHHKKSVSEYYGQIANAELAVRLVKISDRLDNLRTWAVWDDARRRNYAEETVKYVLPLAAATNQEIFESIRLIVNS